MTEYAAIYIVHPIGVVHLEPLAPMLDGDQPTNSEAPVYCNETNGCGHHSAFLGLGASSSKRSPRDGEASPCCVGARED